MISEREGHVLNILVKEYIGTALPVSSRRVAVKMGGRLSPATVRNVFSDLMDDGFIKQEHVSGGRIPTRKGYRMYVNSVLESVPNKAVTPQGTERATACGLDDNLHAFIENVSKDCCVLGGVIGRDEQLLPVGFRPLFSLPEFRDAIIMKEFGIFLDGLEENYFSYNNMLSGEPLKVLIGEENPQKRIRNISIVITHVHKNGIAFMAGPMRMNYERIINVLFLWKRMI